jgi:hypothetical protein
MSKIIIHTEKQNRKNLTCSIGGVIVAFDEELKAHVEESDLKAILEVDPEIGFEGKEDMDIAPAKTAQDEAVESFIEEMGVVEEVSEEDQLVEATDINYDDLTKAALQDVARESELPNKEWSKLNKVKLIAYLKTKL